VQNIEDLGNVFFFSLLLYTTLIINEGQKTIGKKILFA